jgi:hypothetical protein
MSASRSRTTQRRKAVASRSMARIPRKPKLIEIEGGHLLTPEQHGEYEAHQAERHRTHPNNSFLAERQAVSVLR